MKPNTNRRERRAGFNAGLAGDRRCPWRYRTRAQRRAWWQGHACGTDRRARTLLYACDVNDYGPIETTGDAAKAFQEALKRAHVEIARTIGRPSGYSLVAHMAAVGEALTQGVASGIVPGKTWGGVIDGRLVTVTPYRDAAEVAEADKMRATKV